MILSAKVGTNADIFPDVLEIHAKDGWKILDATYGKGVFWQKVNRTRYEVITNDLVTNADRHEDFRKLSFGDSTLDMMVLDPPYAYNPKNTLKESISGCYQNNTSVFLPNMDAVRKLYLDGISEARRVLRKNGILAIKSQDMIQAGKPHWIHKELMDSDGFICEDLYVLVQSSIPACDPKWKRQLHARKNHSFFLIMRKI